MIDEITMPKPQFASVGFCDPAILDIDWTANFDSKLQSAMTDLDDFINSF